MLESDGLNGKLYRPGATACYDESVTVENSFANFCLHSRRSDGIGASHLGFPNATVTFLRQLDDAFAQLCWHDGAKPSQDAAIEHTELLLHFEECSKLGSLVCLLASQ